MRDTLKKVLCSDCASNAMGPKPSEIEILREENILITKECERITSLLAKNGVNPVLQTSLPSSSSHHTSQGRFLNQICGILAPNQPVYSHDHHIYARDPNTPDHSQLAPHQLNISTPTPYLCQDIHVDASALSKDILAPTLDQHNPNVINATIDKNISTLQPNISDDDPLLISRLDYNIPALVTILDQDMATLISSREQK
ncbi:hypothetical protein VNO78_25897 [Psophocarpus tetragonolobus]|uniref:Uncharacterized protein n=1 Tax=Psophocarpus tetragonolobus TaxID=3891 RepID=A0AAN9SB08_PSOTE